MNRSLVVIACIALLLCAGLLLANAQESEASAQAVTKACTDAAVAKAAETQRILRMDLPVDVRHCTYVRHWDINGIASAGITFAFGLGFLAFGLSRRPETA